MIISLSEDIFDEELFTLLDETFIQKPWSLNPKLQRFFGSVVFEL